jgi:hypothetical protein
MCILDAGVRHIHPDDGRAGICVRGGVRVAKLTPGDSGRSWNSAQKDMDRIAALLDELDKLSNKMVGWTWRRSTKWTR